MQPDTEENNESFGGWLTKQRDSFFGTFFVAITLCLACSLVVASAAVGLRERQQTNKAVDKKKNVLLAAGFGDQIKSQDDVNALFKQQIVKELVDVTTGRVLTVEELEERGIDADSYDARKAAKDPAMQIDVEAGALPGIAKQAPLAEVYKIVDGGETAGYVFPVYGNGLWSTLYGFLAVDGDGSTVRGVTYYEHKETPGLGGEVDNTRWKASWVGKQVYQQGKQGVALRVLKGKAASDDNYGIDGLSGATITTKGVDTMIQYWMGPDVFGRYLANQQGGTPHRDDHDDHHDHGDHKHDHDEHNHEHGKG